MTAERPNIARSANDIRRISDGRRPNDSLRHMEVTWAKPLPMIQLLNKDKFFASVEYDQKYWGRKVDRIIEMTNSDEKAIIDCISLVINGDINIHGHR